MLHLPAMTAATSTPTRTKSPALPDFDSVHRPSTSAIVPSLYAGRKTTSPLHFVIVGGGICGLSCAFALSHAGHKVTVLEKDETINKVWLGFDSVSEKVAYEIALLAGLVWSGYTAKY